MTTQENVQFTKESSELFREIYLSFLGRILWNSKWLWIKIYLTDKVFKDLSSFSIELCHLLDEVQIKPEFN